MHANKYQRDPPEKMFARHVRR